MWTPSAPITSICSRMSSKPLIRVSSLGSDGSTHRSHPEFTGAPPDYACLMHESSGSAGCSLRQSLLAPTAMLDVRTTSLTDAQTAEAPPAPTHVTIRREDYRPPDWLVPEISLDFDLGTDR